MDAWTAVAPTNISYIRREVTNAHVSQLICLILEYDVTAEGDGSALLCDPTDCIRAAIDKRVIDVYGTELSGEYYLSTSR